MKHTSPQPLNNATIGKIMAPCCLLKTVVISQRKNGLELPCYVYPSVLNPLVPISTVIQAYLSTCWEMGFSKAVIVSYVANRFLAIRTWLANIRSSHEWSVIFHTGICGAMLWICDAASYGERPSWKQLSKCLKVGVIPYCSWDKLTGDVGIQAVICLTHWTTDAPWNGEKILFDCPANICDDHHTLKRQVIFLMWCCALNVLWDAWCLPFVPEIPNNKIHCVHTSNNIHLWNISALLEIRQENQFSNTKTIAQWGHSICCS